MKRLFSMMSLIFSALVAVACGGLGGEPEIVQTLPPPAPMAAVSPYIEVGSALYPGNCAACHGPNGAGDGELALNGSVQNPGNFSTKAHAEDQTPLDYYTIITNGNIENLMPPWENQFDEARRWSLAIYSYTLHYTPAMIEIGETLLRDVVFPTELSNPQMMAQVSDGAIRARLAAGEIDIPQLWSDLTENEQDSVVAYIRTLSIGGPVESLGLPAGETVTMVQDDEATPEPLPADAMTGTINGTITHGTAGFDVPDDLTVELVRFSPAGEQSIQETTVNPAGTFTFDDVALIPGHTYLTSAEYATRRYASQPVEFTVETPTTLDLSFVLYELTDDPAVITVNNIISQMRPSGNFLEFIDTITLINTADRAFLTDRIVDLDDRRASLEFQIPPGGIFVGMDGLNNFIIDNEDGTLTATSPIFPGEEYQINMRYIVPYEDGAIIEYPLNYPLDGTIGLLLTDDAVTPAADWIVTTGERNIQGQIFDVYGGPISLDVGDVVRFEVSGATEPIGTSADDNVITQNRLLPILLIVSALVIGVVGGIIIWANRSPEEVAVANQNQLIDELLRQINQLDAEHDAGRINHDVYQRRKATLQDRLNTLMDGTDAADRDA
jgi:mono/diheme cytochrome c family protein